MSLNDEISRMTDEVMRDVREKKVSFNRAFSWAAHRRQIFFEVERPRYNYFFSEVRRRFSRRNNAALRTSLQGERSWQHGKIIRDHPPAKGKFYKNDPWETQDPENSSFCDNAGYVHDFSNPYIEGCPEE